MTITVKELSNPIALSLLSTLRDKDTKTPEFAGSTRRLGQFLFFEACEKKAPTKDIVISSPMEECKGITLNQSKIKLIAILRAGLGLLDGVRDIAPAAACGMISESRDHDTKKPTIHHVTLPRMDKDDHIFVCEPMLATGGSAIAALKKIREVSPQSRLVLLSLIAAPEAIENIKASGLQGLEIYTVSIDRGLNKDKYIMPGLGDAGDRIFATD